MKKQNQKAPKRPQKRARDGVLHTILQNLAHDEAVREIRQYLHHSVNDCIDTGALLRSEETYE
jgi:hypothetical protein